MCEFTDQAAKLSGCHLHVLFAALNLLTLQTQLVPHLHAIRGMNAVHRLDQTSGGCVSKWP